MYDLIIIGGGPAGISAGIYAARKKLNTLLVTKDFAGQVTKAGEIENYPGFESISGMELMTKMRKHLEKFEIKVKGIEKVREIKKTEFGFEIVTESETLQSKAVVITSGKDPRPLEVPGEKELIGKGVSYCALCDAPFFKDKVVAVVGGGNSAFGTAMDLIKYAIKVYVFESGTKVLADEIIQERVKSSGKAEIILNAKIKEIQGKEKVESIVYIDNGGEKNLAVQGVFVAIGSIPATGFVKGLVDFNDNDEIVINPKTCETKTPGIFAAGDVTDVKYKQAIIAAGEGAKASLSAYEYLQNMKN